MRSCLLAFVFASALAASADLHAQNALGKGVRVVVPSPPGNFNDVIARALVQGFSERFAPGSYVDNKPGAGTVIGTESVVKSPPDGAHILIVSFPFTVMNVLYPNVKFRRGARLRSDYAYRICAVATAGERSFAL